MGSSPKDMQLRAYAVEDMGEGEYHIHVYDSNTPARASM
jgi:hypothetical protein